ncbi:uncharacterized protein PV07_02235 [Cladophialophora immunda]|uniref:Stress-response A/B barrel domain-containing protein n=1 Tax=Cladophialophora immunda TaxID=569365 RepID=A0A0D2D025_9EURO|nr:uncharacterized protein PV07_02235 [Cladophialophora immunda]KIW35545.1 hypothetical protein PV07_02235 [Cladophialophora immunda]OQV04836.1 hypothetical protein CLAIMM_09660 [Cladophialophora immunda]
MGLYHMGNYCLVHRLSEDSKLTRLKVLFKFKNDTDPEDLKTLDTLSSTLLGKVSGLVDMKTGPPLPATSARAKGFEYAAVATLEGAQFLDGFVKHPIHGD